MAAAAAAHPEAERVELWFADEARVGQKGRVTRLWYERGVRPRGLRDLGFASAYLFGAVCPERDAGVALVLPPASTAAMTLLLAELAQALPAGTHAVVVLDRASYHTARDLVRAGQPDPGAPAAILARTEPHREGLAVPARPALQPPAVPRRCCCGRRLLRRLEPPARRARPDPLADRLPLAPLVRQFVMRLV